MNKKKLIIALIIEVAVLTGIYLLSAFVPEFFSAVHTFPLEQIARGLGALAALGNVGNGAALAITVAISMIPAIMAMKIKRPEQLGKTDRLRNVEKVALWITTCAVFFAFYIMMNPYLFVNISYAGGTFTDTSRLAMIYMMLYK